ncbi:hypothetical protein ACIBQX_11050 [Nonomuraea sp. NPDC049714]|uniref:hypothetical protein n=1 Tax=Nonomuraea sp. NPDC049714 TaxID=3364357 RepID=UPI0037B1534F
MQFTRRLRAEPRKLERPPGLHRLVSLSARTDGQQQVLDRLTDDWSQQQRLGFCRAMISLIQRCDTLTA